MDNDIVVQYIGANQKYNQTGNVEGLHIDLNALESIVSSNAFYLEREFLSEYYSVYAFACFELKLYADFFRLLIMANKFGYDMEIIRKSLLQVFVEPNLERFKENYEEYSTQIKNHWINGGLPFFEHLRYYPLPTEKENIVCLMNKVTGELTELVDVDFDEVTKINIDNKFSDHVVKREWNELKGHLKYCQENKKNCYYIADDPHKIYSLLQAEDIGDQYLKYLTIVSDRETLLVHIAKENHSIPWNIRTYTEDRDWLLGSFETMRKERCKKATNKVPMLSICIPSYNRGNSAYKNVKELLDMRLDHEIEIVLSNNGSDNESKTYYEQLKLIEDKRFRYHEFDKNKGYIENSCKVVDMAKGKFLLLLSDEDSLYEDGLYSILKEIQKSGNCLSIIKTPHKIQGAVEPGYATAGRAAYEKYMLTSNYLSINIWKSSLLKQKDFVYYPLAHMDNQACLYYPHMCWELFVLQFGDVLSSDIFLVHEGEAIKTINTEQSTMKTGKIINHYQTIEGRLEQHKGFVDIILLLDISRNDNDIKMMMYQRLCEKTFFLVDLSLHVFYQVEEWSSQMESVYKLCKESTYHIINEPDCSMVKEQLQYIDDLYEYYTK